MVRIGVEHNDFRKVICEVDCASLPTAKEDEDSDRYCRVIAEINCYHAKNWMVSFKQVPRECNAPADWFARFASSSPSPGTSC